MGSTAPSTRAGDEEQSLQQAIKNVKSNAVEMRRALEEESIKEALKHSAQFLSELRTSSLSPQMYYALYTRILDELHYLERAFLDECTKREESALELYETVQYAGNIVPRLYLLITVGRAYMQVNPSSAKEVLNDLVNMARGVQQPLRGLFLRAYLSQASKTMLPDSPDHAGGNIDDSVDFVLQNFVEMNKLWCRMEHQDRDGDPERDRQELRDLVGKNLLVLSQLEGVNLHMYKAKVLPRILEQIVNCEDGMAQTYLMQAVVQVFPDEFHLATLDDFLRACTQLDEGVHVGQILESLMDRLGNFAVEAPETAAWMGARRAFAKVYECISSLQQVRSLMQADDLATVHAGLLTFAIRTREDAIECADEVLGSCAAVLEGQEAPLGTAALEELDRVVGKPLEAFSLVDALALENLPRLLGLLPEEARVRAAQRMARAALAREAPVGSAADARLLLDFLSPLLRHDASKEDHSLMAKLLHYFWCDSVDDQLSVLSLLRSGALHGGLGASGDGIASYANLCLRLANRVGKERRAEDGQEALRNACEAANMLASLDGQAERAHRLWLRIATAADELECPEIVYHAAEEAIWAFEEGPGTAAARKESLAVAVGCLQGCASFSPGDWSSVAGCLEAHCGSLMRRVDQARASLLCACLHVGVPERPPPGEGRVRALVEARGEVAAVKLQVPQAKPGRSASEAGVRRCLEKAWRAEGKLRRQRLAALGRADEDSGLLADMALAHARLIAAGVPGVEEGWAREAWRRASKAATEASGEATSRLERLSSFLRAQAPSLLEAEREPTS